MNKWRVYLSAVGVWFAFSFAAFSMGALREGLITPAFGEHAAHVIGTLLFLLVMLAIMGVFIQRIGRAEQRVWWLIGLMWNVMTPKVLGATACYELHAPPCGRHQFWLG